MCWGMPPSTVPSITMLSRPSTVPDFTVTLVPTVRVLRIQNPEVDTETGRSDSSRIQITLDLLPQDAQNLVFA